MKAKVAALALIATSACQVFAEPTRNPSANLLQISSLPPEIGQPVLAMCATAPAASPPFAISQGDQFTLHFEFLKCERPTIGYCNETKCLKQTFQLLAGRYRLIKSVYEPRNVLAQSSTSALTTVPQRQR